MSEGPFQERKNVRIPAPNLLLAGPCADAVNGPIRRQLLPTIPDEAAPAKAAAAHSGRV
jgi:hypothetical protein